MGTDAAGLLLRVRRYSRLSQARFAERAEIPRSVLNTYERGRRDPGTEATIRLAASAGVELRPVATPRRPDPQRAARILDQVLDLAEALPYRPKKRIAAAPFR